LWSVRGRVGGFPRTTATRDSWCTLEGAIPAAKVHGLRQRIPSLTSGQGVLETAFDHYQPVRGEPPSRPRTDHNPLDRNAYLVHFVRRV